MSRQSARGPMFGDRLTADEQRRFDRLVNARGESGTARELGIGAALVSRLYGGGHARSDTISRVRAALAALVALVLVGCSGAAEEEAIAQQQPLVVGCPTWRVVVDDELDPAPVARALAQWHAASSGRVGYTLAAGALEDRPVDEPHVVRIFRRSAPVWIDGAPNGEGGIAYVFPHGGATVTIDDGLDELATPVVAHELGHVFGLTHGGGIMSERLSVPVDVDADDGSRYTCGAGA